VRELHHDFARVNGIRMHYVTAGSGPLLLLLHGFPDFWFSWRRQIPALAGRFTVVAPDQRGYNESDKPGWGYSVDVLVADIMELIAALGHERAMLLGHDWGGAVAWAAAIARPQRVARLAVINSPHPASFAEQLRRNPRQMARSAYMGFFALPLLPELALSAGNYAVIERELRRDLPGGAISEAEIAAYKDAIGKPGALTAALGWYRAAARQGPRGLFAGTGMRCQVPTLQIWGDRDPYLGPELYADTGRFAPDLTSLPIPGAGHWAHQWAPAQVNAALLAFFGGGAGRDQLQ
jgi:pimeloyl-ACP methyl ester carboxylesterase